METRIKLLSRLKIQLKGHICLGFIKKDGWKEPAPVYVFKCPIHGYVQSVVRGYNERLECPICLQELKNSPPEVV
jgi:hypothetical protein